MQGRSPKVERNNRIVALRREGMMFQQIGDELGISRQAAHQAYMYVITGRQNVNLLAPRHSVTPCPKLTAMDLFTKHYPKIPH